MKKVFLALVLLISCICISSCSILDEFKGKSAYEIAVEYGFEGSEEEWLESLKGEDGKDGSGSGNSSSGDVNNITIEGGSSDVTAAVNKGLFSAVLVYCSFSYSGNQNASSSGSGVIYELDKAKGDATIITNYHVVYNSNDTSDDHIIDNIQIGIYGKEYSNYLIPATYIGGSMNYDVALLKISNSDIIKNANVAAASIGSSDNLVLGSTTIVIGNAGGEGISAISGIVSKSSEYITLTGADDVTSIQFHVFRTDAGINMGNSGGGVFNNKGELIGIVNAKTVKSTYEGMGYALPIKDVLAVIYNIKYNVEHLNYNGVKKALLGITITQSETESVYDSQTGTFYLQETISVNAINDDSVTKNDLKVDDILVSVSVDGVEDEIHHMEDMLDRMLHAHSGSEVKIKIDRDGTEMSFTYQIVDSQLTNIA